MTNSRLARAGVCAVLIGLLTVPPAAAQNAEPVRISLADMALGGPPIGFAPGLTGSGGPVMWQIRPDATAPGGKVIGQVSQDRIDNRFPVLLYNGAMLRDVDVSVRFKPISGRSDRAAGIIVRARDSNNYYVVRANALEDNVNIYRVVGGRRIQFGEADVPVASGQWQTLRLSAEGSTFKVWLNDQILFAATDAAIAGAGRIGLWTKSDSVTLFEGLTYTNLAR